MVRPVDGQLFVALFDGDPNLRDFIGQRGQRVNQGGYGVADSSNERIGPRGTCCAQRVPRQQAPGGHAVQASTRVGTVVREQLAGNDVAIGDRVCGQNQVLMRFAVRAKVDLPRRPQVDVAPFAACPAVGDSGGLRRRVRLPAGRRRCRRSAKRPPANRRWPPPAETWPGRVRCGASCGSNSAGGTELVCQPRCATSSPKAIAVASHSSLGSERMEGLRLKPASARSWLRVFGFASSLSASPAKVPSNAASSIASAVSREKTVLPSASGSCDDRAKRCRARILATPSRCARRWPGAAAWHPATGRHRRHPATGRAAAGQAQHRREVLCGEAQCGLDGGQPLDPQARDADVDGRCLGRPRRGGRPPSSARSIGSSSFPGRQLTSRR